MRHRWDKKKLGEIIKLEYGKPLPKDKRKSDGKYPVYGANGEKDRTNEYYCNRPSIIVGRKGSAGEINLTEERFWPLDVTYFVTFDDKKYDLNFLYNLLSTLNLPKLAKGVKPGINRNEVYDIGVNTPLLVEQKRVVKALDKVFEKTAKAKENAEKNLQNARELFESFLQNIFAHPGDNWERCNLEDYIKFIDYRGRTPEKTESGMRLITAKNVKIGYLQMEPREYVHPSIYKTWMTRGIPRIGDVLFTTEAPLANVAQLDTDEKVVFSQRIIIFQPMPNKLDQTFLKYLLLSKPLQERIHAKSTGATVKGIKARWLKKIPIEFPALAEQRVLVAKLDSLLAETKKLEAIYQQKLMDLEELKKLVLHKAFNGELAGVCS